MLLEVDAVLEANSINSIRQLRGQPLNAGGAGLFVHGAGLEGEEVAIVQAC